MGGLPKSIVKKYGISKKAWSVFRAERQNRKANKPTPNNKSSVRPMTKNNKKTRKRSFLSFGTITKFIKIGALVAPAVHAAIKYQGDQKVVAAINFYTGYNMNDGKFRWEELAKGWMPFVATSLAVTGIQKLNGIIKRL